MVEVTGNVPWLEIAYLNPERKCCVEGNCLPARG